MAISAGAGTYTSAIGFGGATISMQVVQSAKQKIWNGTSWTEVS